MRQIVLHSPAWVPTPAAALMLGVSAKTLRRYSNSETGFLEPGKHWRRGVYPTSPNTYDVEACREVMHRRGMKAYAEAPLPGTRRQSAQLVGV